MAEDIPPSPTEAAAVAGTIPALIEAQCQARPGAVALITPDGDDISFLTLNLHVQRLRSQLAGCGIGPGARVALVLPTGAALGVMFLACAGVATTVPLNPAYTEQEFDFYLADAGVRLLVLPEGTSSPAEAVARARDIPVVRLRDRTPGAGFAPNLVDAPVGRVRPTGPDDIALVLHTSGTTSRPKIVPLRHTHICASVADVARATGLTERDRCLHAMPMFHIGGLIDLLVTPLSVGGSVAFLGPFSARTVYDKLATSGASWLQVVPTMLQELLDAAPGAAPMHDLRLIRAVAAALPKETRIEAEALFGVPVLETFGMTEAAPLITSTTPGGAPEGSVGQSVGPEIRIIGDEGPLAPDQIGEIAIRGPNVIDGYENNPDANAASFKDGWFLTGDLGCLDAEGHLYLKGRSKEIVNRGGQKVSPSEIDAVLMAHPSVRQLASFGVPHKTLGEEIAVLVVPVAGAGLTAESFADFARTVLADHKVPRIIRIVEDIPKSATGKLQRHKLADHLAGLSDTTEAGGDDGPVDRVVAAAQTLLNDADVLASDNFFARGGNSLLAARFSTMLTDDLGQTVPMSLIFRSQSLRALARAIAGGDAALGPAPVTLSRARLVTSGPEPLFSVNATGSYAKLAKHLHPDRPVVGTSIFGLNAQDPGRHAAATLDDLAAHVVAEVTATAYAGPLHVIAFCQDGPLAVEAVRKIAASGAVPPHLILIDSFFQPLVGTPGHVLRNALRLGLPYLWRKLPLRSRKRTPRRFEDMTPEEKARAMDKVQRDRTLYRRYVEMFHSYRPEPYAGPVTLILSDEWRGADLTHVHRLGAQGLHIRRVRGMHNHLFDARSVPALGAAVEEVITRVARS